MKNYKWRMFAGVCLFCILLSSGCRLPMEFFASENQQQAGEKEPGEQLSQDSFKKKETQSVETGLPQLGYGPKEPAHEVIQSISAGKYAYESLNAEGQQVYDQMLDAILSYKDKVELVTIDEELMRQAYQALTSDYGSLFWVAGYTYTSYTMGDAPVSLEFAPNYTMEKQEKDALQIQVDAVVEEWLGGISFHDSDYDKAKYVFETLIEQVDYVEDSLENQNILSVFLHKQTVCQGYASATQYLLRQLEIPSVIVSGYANQEPHAWNLVKLDGAYYHMDTTWGNSTYLDTDSNEAKFVNYNYMCMTDEEIAMTHTPQMLFALPACNSMEHNYYVKEGRYFETWEPEAMGNAFQEAWLSGQPSVTVKCASEELYAQMKDYFITQQRIADYCDGIASFFYMEAPELCVLTMNFN